MMERPDVSSDFRDPGDVAFAAEPVVDVHAVRFTLFLGLRGPQVFEVPLTVMQDLGAPRTGDDAILAVFHAFEQAIARAARAHRDTHGHAVITLTTAEIQRGSA